MLIVIVLNRRFLCNAQTPGYPVGAAGFVHSVAPAFERAGHTVRFVTYERARHDRISVSYGEVFDRPTFSIAFSYRNSVESAADAFQEATRRLYGDNPDILFYHQSSATVPLTPANGRCVVTHHAPFVDEVVNKLGHRRAVVAFGGQEEKLKALFEFQRRAISWLRQAPDSLCVELSDLQRRCVIARGVPVSLCHTALAPIDVKPTAKLSPTHSLALWLQGEAKTKLLIAASRLDGFKNVEGAIHSLQKATSPSFRVALYVAAGDSGEEAQRAALLAAIPASMMPSTHVRPRWSHDQLIANLKAAAGKATFWFPSHYETLGITPLQALKCGMTLAVPYRPDCIGMLEYVSGEHSYTDGEGVNGLANFFSQSDRAAQKAGGLLTDTSSSAFVARFLRLADTTQPVVAAS